MQKNQIVAIVAVIGIVIGVGLIAWQLMGKGGGGSVDTKANMICESCGYTFEYNPSGSGGGPMMIMPSMAVECPKCHKKTAYRAGKCVHCGAIFSLHRQMQKQHVGMNFDQLKCPKCGQLAFK